MLKIGRTFEIAQNSNQQILGHFNHNGNEFDRQKESESDSDYSDLSNPKGYRNFSIGIISSRGKIGRNNYSDKIIEILIQWLHLHIEYPYPNQQQRVDLCNITGLDRKQLRMWFIDARRVRIPLLMF